MEGEQSMATASREADPQTRSGLARVDEAAEFLAVSRAHLYSLMDSGTLKYVKLGRSRRIPWRALEELAARGTRD
jgi:excisionase family DNA binding protein